MSETVPLLGVVIFLAVGSGLTWKMARVWYFRRIERLQSQVRHRDGLSVPGGEPQFLFGHLPDIYRSHNRLAGYLSFHHRFGEFIQIFWLWKQQISVSSYPIAQQILQAHAANYQKYPPNALLKKLFGSSVLTSHGEDWRRYRLLTQAALAPQRLPDFSDRIVSCTKTLVQQWEAQIQTASDGEIVTDIYPDLTALCLDIIGAIALGDELGALQGEAAHFLENIQLIITQSTLPQHQFAHWWRHVPLQSNRRLAQAFAEVDAFLENLIQARRTQGVASGEGKHLLDRLLHATQWAEESVTPLSDREVRDNLLAVILNGYESAATCLALTLDRLARHPEVTARAQMEVDRCFNLGPLQVERVGELPYLECVLQEALRLSPPMTGIQRVSVGADVLAGWSLPAQQVIGIALMPLHQDEARFGPDPQLFRPERYRHEDTSRNDLNRSKSQCPFRRVIRSGKQQNGIHWPLAFGDGPRRCVGEALAMVQMLTVLAFLLRHFEFSAVPEHETDVDLGKFGLFISMVPKTGVYLCLRQRHLTDD